MEGFVWAAILNAENYTALTVPLMKSGASALCATGPVNASAATATDVLLSSCNLEPGAPNMLVAYAEDPNGADDGVFSNPLVVVVPASSSSLLVQPTLVGTPTSDSVTLDFSPAAYSGYAWISIVPEAHSAGVAIAHLLANDDPSNHAMGGAACRYSNRTASRGLQDATLTGCALTRGASYKGFDHAFY